MKYTEYKQLNLPSLQKEVLDFWKKEDIFKKSIESRSSDNPFVFYEGPPSANGMPGIHHVMARTIKDLFCRYQTLKGKQVKRKAGWDTHGLPVELGVEKELGITKEDIGKKITIEEYNRACREAVMRYTDKWNELTEIIGFWVDMDDPYITYKTKYIESVWWILSQLAEKDLMYKGYTIQPYSPKAGTGLSSHELNQPGAYRDVKDTSAIAMFRVVKNEKTAALWGDAETFFTAWTTTPWTLPSNTALAVGKKIEYTLVQTCNQYDGNLIRVILATDLLPKYFSPEGLEAPLEDFEPGSKVLPYRILKTFRGSEITGLQYEQLLPFAQPYQDAEKAFRVIAGDFVTTEDGTGIVHIAPTFGADDQRVAREAGVPPMLVLDDNGNPVPLVDLQGRFVKQMGPLAGKYVKNEYYEEGKAPDKSVDVEIAIMLKEKGQAFKVEKYEHSYPHCWRTDKPILYYPLDSWFIRSTSVKEKLIANNQKINWKPESTGTGRFGNWLENLNDWNLSRSRFWGIPLPIWRTEDGSEQTVIGSLRQLKAEIEKAVKAGVMDKNPLAGFDPDSMADENYDAVDLHRPYVDRIVLISASGKPMKRENDLIDVWFDSGSMPYAQWHYPFENKELIDAQKFYPADFIAEGVDQTRGWFFTLHAIATMAFDSVAYKNVVSNGLVLDKNGLKMSKRLGNAVDPFKTVEKHGADAVRWYMVTNAQPWDNLKFDLAGVEEVQRKFFGTLYNTYGFFALYANVDGFRYSEDEIPLAERPEIDRWILSELNTLIKTVDENLANYEPTKAFRPVQDFVIEKLSNWYVRLCRKRFWRGTYEQDKISAYQTLYTCLETVARLAAPLAPFYTDRLYRDLVSVTGKDNVESVHLANFPVANEGVIDKDLEKRMQMAQEISSMVLSLRKKERIRVRQPLQKIIVPVLDQKTAQHLENVKDLILTEVNVKELEIVDDAAGVFEKSVKPNFKTLGPKLGPKMKAVNQQLAQFTTAQINAAEQNGSITLEVGGESVEIGAEDLEITTKEIPGMLMAREYGRTVALDITITPELKAEGLARELVNRLQNLRKDAGLEVTDRIILHINADAEMQNAIEKNKDYICSETLINQLEFEENMSDGKALDIENVTISVKLKPLGENVNKF